MAFNLEETKKTAKTVARRTFWFSLLLAVLALAGYYVYRTWVYSDGTRSGMLIKASRKGNILKTYEGQLHLGNSAMMTDQSVWNFSIKDKATYDALQPMEGKTVKCYYKELKNAFPWQGDTNYIVYKVEKVE